MMNRTPNTKPRQFKLNGLFFLLSLFSLQSFAQEICNNGIDDDGDGLIDCLDPDCLDDVANCPAFAFPGSCLPIGYYPDITGTAGGYKPGGSVANVTIPIPASTNRASLIIQGVYQQAPVDALTGMNDLNHAQERIIWGRVELDLDNSTSSGWVEYAVNNHESRRFSWVDQDMGPASTDTYTRVGHDFAELKDFEFVFDSAPGNLIIGCSEAAIDISYYSVFFGNFDSQSMTSVAGADPTQYPAYFDAGSLPINRVRTIDMLSGADAPDYVQIRAVGINQNRRGNSGVLVENTREEAMSIKYMIIDLGTMKASGNLTVNNGNIPDMNSTFTFSNYDVTSGLSILATGTLLGDSDGNITPPNQIAVCDMTLEVVGDQLILTRSNEYGNDFNEIYYIEFLKYSDQPYSSSFYITKNAYSSPTDISFDFGASNNGVSVAGFVDFEIPQGSKRGYLEIRANGLYSPYSLASFEGLAPTNTERTNGNQMYAFTEVNFDLEETTGYFVTITTATEQQLYAWQEIPINPLIDITTLDIYGQLPNNDERLNFEIIPPNTFRVHLENDKIAYERILNMTFLGSKVNLIYSTFEHNDALTTGCDSVHFDMEVCNSGGADLTLPVPVSFYTADPTVDPGAIYLQTSLYDLAIKQGQCKNFSFAIDISSLGGGLTGNITVVLNDDGSFAGAPGTVIPAIFDALDLADQDSPVLECEYQFNIITSDYKLTLPPKPIITFNEDLFVICPTDEVTIIASTSGTFGEIDYTWSPKFGDANKLTVSPDMTTWFTLTIQDECHIVKDSVKIEIGSVDVSEIIVIDAETCPKVPGILGSIEILPDDPGWTYTMTGGGDVFGPTDINKFTGLTGGVYYLLHIEDLKGCFLDTAIFVDLGINNVSFDFVVDSLRDVSCYGANDGGAYVSNINGGLMPPYQVIWSSFGVVFDVESGLPLGGAHDIDNLYGGKWTVTVLDAEGCAKTELFSIAEPDLLTIDVIFNSPTCFMFTDGSITINSAGGNSGNVYEIKNEAGVLVNKEGSNTANTLGEGTYTCRVTDAKGCTAEATVTLKHPKEIEVDLKLTNPLCYGLATGLAEVESVYNYTGDFNKITYGWTPNLGQPGGIGADVLNNVPAGTYVLTVNDENGCTNTFDFVITQPTALKFVELGFDPAYCRLYDYQKGNGVVYASGGGGTPSYTYQWDDLGKEISVYSSTWGGLNPGEYQITVIDANGCTLTEIVQLDSLNPVADFSITSPQFTKNYEGTAPVSAHFINLSKNYDNPNSPSGLPTFFWNFDNKGDGVGWILTHDVTDEYDTTYTIGNTYEACLVAINKNGCSDTLCKTIVVYDPLIFVAVNVFTPNEDGVNDLFTFDFRADAVSEFNCVIVNRWGIEVFEMNSIKDGWDGKDKKGKECSDGVYFYTYTGKADNGDPFKGQGTVSLLRN